MLKFIVQRKNAIRKNVDIIVVRINVANVDNKQYEVNKTLRFLFSLNIILINRYSHDCKNYFHESFFNYGIKKNKKHIF